VFAIDKIQKLNHHPMVYGAWAAAVLAGLAAWFFLHHLEDTYQESSDTVTILMADRYIPRGTVLRKAYFRMASIPKAYVAPDAIHQFDILESSGQPLWRSVLSIPEGTLLSQRELMPLAQAGALSRYIGENQVAVSFGIDRVRGIGGNLQPGDLIDVLHTPKAQEFNSTPQSTDLLFQALRIIAIGEHREGETIAKETSESPNEEETIILTVLLNPVAAVRLAQARENETLSVVLRAPDDVAPLDAR
jgi:Flp pilus assembly protein CpaB